MATKNVLTESELDENRAGEKKEKRSKPDEDLSYRDSEELERQHFQRVTDAFMYYQSYAMRRLEQKMKYFSEIPTHHQAMVPTQIGRFDKVKQAIIENYSFVKNIVNFADNMFCNSNLSRQSGDAVSKHPLLADDMDRVKTTIRQCVRDWAEEGLAERNHVYKPILQHLTKLYPGTPSERGHVNVLVPGAGLGRLMLDISNLGFSCQGNEFSFYMLFASNYILNKCQKESVTIYPWIHQTANVFSNNDQVRPVKIPDISPTLINENSNFSMSAGDFMEVFTQPEEFDCVAMSFFLDTAHNPVAYIEKVYKILKPGGYWLNFGPLLYHFADVPNEPSVELTYQELRAVILDSFKFKLIEEKVGIKCGYVQNPKSMLQMNYSCVFFVVQKPNK